MPLSACPAGHRCVPRTKPLQSDEAEQARAERRRGGAEPFVELPVQRRGLRVGPAESAGPLWQSGLPRHRRHEHAGESDQAESPMPSSDPRHSAGHASPRRAVSNVSTQPTPSVIGRKQQTKTCRSGGRGWARRRGRPDALGAGGDRVACRGGGGEGARGGCQRQTQPALWAEAGRGVGGSGR